MAEIVAGPGFVLFITIGLYLLFTFVAHKLAMPYLNPLALSSITILLLIYYTKIISIEQYTVYGNALTFFIAPLTVSLAVPLYHQRHILIKKWPLFLMGTMIAIFTSLATTIIPARLLGLDEQIIRAMAPKLVTTPIAVEVAARLQALVPLAAIAAVVSGITGYLVAPLICRMIKIGQPMAQGFAIGASSHILGSIRASEMGELQVACATIAISSVGIATTIILPFVFKGAI